MGNELTKKNSYELELTKGRVVRVKKTIKCENKCNTRKRQQGHIKTTRTKCWKFGFSLLAFFFVLNFTAAIVLWGTNLYYDSLHQMLYFTKDGLVFDIWTNKSVSRVVSVYLFNYTNTAAIKRRNEKPHVKELGPFVYREDVKRVNVEFHENGTLTYQENRTLVFLPDESTGSLSDTIIIPNFPVLAAHNIENSNMLERSGVSFIKLVAMPKDFIKASVNDLIWGHDDSFTRVTSVLQNILKQEKPNKFGILSPRNGLSPDRVTIETGCPNQDRFGFITRYNGQSTLGSWNDETCDRIEGSDGTLFPWKSIVRNATLTTFAKELCRKVPLQYEKDIVTDDGIPAFRYRMPADIFECADKNPANKCYCKKGNCSPCGTFNTAPCHFRIPLVMSLPHFTHADPILREKVTGLTPDPEKYQTYIDVHEYGVTINGVSRFQANLFLNKSSNHPWLNLADGTVLPIAWLETKNGEFSEFTKMLIYNLTYTAPLLEKFMRYGSFFMLLFIPMIMFLMMRSGKCGGVNLH